MTTEVFFLVLVWILYFVCRLWRETAYQNPGGVLDSILGHEKFCCLLV